jgi:DNA topoisomerase-1
VKHNDKYISIPRADQQTPLSLERAIELILAKRQAEANKYIKEFPENPAIKVVNGQYGPYLAVGKRNVKIPKDVDPASLTLDDCLKLAGEDPAAAKETTKKSTTKAAAKAPAKAKAATAEKKTAAPKKAVAKKK